MCDGMRWSFSSKFPNGALGEGKVEFWHILGGSLLIHPTIKERALLVCAEVTSSCLKIISRMELNLDGICPLQFLTALSRGYLCPTPEGAHDHILMKSWHP